jgi:hypothetical protein
VYVWDVLQTEGKDLPNYQLQVIQTNGFRGNRVCSGARHQARILEKIAPARGLSCGGLIQLLPNMTAAEEFNAMRDLAHEMIHKAERRALTAKQSRKPRPNRCFCSGKSHRTLKPEQHPLITFSRGDAKLLQESLKSCSGPQRSSWEPSLPSDRPEAAKTTIRRCGGDPLLSFSIRSVARLVEPLWRSGCSRRALAGVKATSDHRV